MLVRPIPNVVPIVNDTIEMVGPLLDKLEMKLLYSYSFFYIILLLVLVFQIWNNFSLNIYIHLI